MAGAVVFLAYIAFVIWLLVLLVRFVNAVEKIATASEHQERQVGRLAVAVEQLAVTRGATRPSDPPDEGSAPSNTGNILF